MDHGKDELPKKEGKWKWKKLKGTLRSTSLYSLLFFFILSKLTHAKKKKKTSPFPLIKLLFNCREAEKELFLFLLSFCPVFFSLASLLWPTRLRFMHAWDYARKQIHDDQANMEGWQWITKEYIFIVWNFQPSPRF